MNDRIELPLNTLEDQNIDAEQVTKFMQQISSNEGLTTAKCKQDPTGYKQETDGVIPKQLNNFVLKPSTKTNDWNAKIKCTNSLGNTFYYLGRYGHRLYISHMHSLDKPMLFLRNDGTVWSIFAIGAYFPCTQNNHHKPNAIAESTTDGARTALIVNKEVEFYPAWALLYISKNVDYHFGYAHIYKFQNNLRLSDSKYLRAFFKEDPSSNVYVYDKKAKLVTEQGLQDVAFVIRMYDDYYETAITSTSSWKAVMDTYFVDNIHYIKNEAEDEFFKVPVKKMKNFLMKAIREAKVSQQTLWFFTIKRSQKSFVMKKVLGIRLIETAFISKTIFL